MRIIHFEDEWPKARSIAHRLHDRVFEVLRPEVAVELELHETENEPKCPCRIVVLLGGSYKKEIFEYQFITEFEFFKSTVKEDDVVIVDIMRSDANGRFVSILNDVLEAFKCISGDLDRWRYFSAYSERVPSGCVLTGFTKYQEEALLEFLLGRIKNTPDFKGFGI